MKQDLLYWFILLFIFHTTSLSAQTEGRPEIPASLVTGAIKLDGILDEADWTKATLVNEFKTIVPEEGGQPSGQTTMRVLTHPKFLLIGIECFDDHPEQIVNYQTLVGVRVRFNASPDLQLNSFIQYDTETKNMGINARIHWIFHPQGDLFLVFNHNTFDGLERWELINQQFLMKARYNFRL